MARNKFVADNASKEIAADNLQQITNAATVLYMRKNNFASKSRACPLETVPVSDINYKNLKLIEQFVSERGKILPSRITGVSAKKQRALKTAIKQARVIALLAFEKN